MAVPSRKHRASHNKQLLKEKKFKDEVAKQEKEEKQEKNPEDVKRLFASIEELKNEIKKKKEHNE
jgi:hypothetical protein